MPSLESIVTTLPTHSLSLHVQTREEGKSVLQEAIKWRRLLESAGQGKEMSLLNPDEELSPIAIASHTKLPDTSSN